ncbi:MAG: DinB family protein [Isosphaeraceae bacterium]|nr:DinB family protein [Isosphaeraceae bacterium]
MNARLKLIERYEAGGAFLVAAISLLEPEDAARPVGPGTWSIAEIVVHLLQSDMVDQDRLERVLTEESPTLAEFDPNARLARFPAAKLPITDAADLFNAARRWTAARLRLAADADFARAGTLGDRGRVTLAELLSSGCNHLDHHLRFLYAKRGAIGRGIPPRFTSN